MAQEWGSPLSDNTLTNYRKCQIDYLNRILQSLWQIRNRDGLQLSASWFPFSIAVKWPSGTQVVYDLRGLDLKLLVDEHPDLVPCLNYLALRSIFLRTPLDES